MLYRVFIYSLKILILATNKALKRLTITTTLNKSDPNNIQINNTQNAILGLVVDFK